MRITTKGQVTIPQDIRDRFGLMPHTGVVFDGVGDSVGSARRRTATGAGAGVDRATYRGTRRRPAVDRRDHGADTRGD